MIYPYFFLFFPFAYSKQATCNSKSFHHVHETRKKKLREGNLNGICPLYLGQTSVQLQVQFVSNCSEQQNASTKNQSLKHSLEELVQKLNAIEQGITKRLDTIEHSLQNTAQKSYVTNEFKALHDRLETLEKTACEQANDKFIQRLILLYDLLPSDHSGSSGESQSPLTIAIRNDLREVLKSIDVTPFSVVGEIFDPSQQRCIGFLTTDIPDSDGKIACSERVGFRNATRIIRPESVTLWKTEPQSTLIK